MKDRDAREEIQYLRDRIADLEQNVHHLHKGLLILGARWVPVRIGHWERADGGPQEKKEVA